MRTDEKLKIIQKLSRLTQSELAGELDVSFPILNSWINNKSAPRAKKLQKIDFLYEKHTGHKKPQLDRISAKKEIILRKAKSCKNIIKLIKERPDIYDQLVLSFTYNTNSIEGSTLTENETACILFEGMTIKNKNLVEHLEAKNHQSALNYLFSVIKKDYQIDEEFILKLHEILMNNIKSDAGIYRNHGIRIVSANVPTANYLKVPCRMEALVKAINATHQDVIIHIASVHSEFEQIHPFSDGNGRIGRLIMAAMLLRKNLPPAVVKKQNKMAYYKCLQASQLKQEHEELEDFLCDAILNGFEVLEPSRQLR